MRIEADKPQILRKAIFFADGAGGWFRQVHEFWAGEESLGVIVVGEGKPGSPSTLTFYADQAPTPENPMPWKDSEGYDALVPALIAAGHDVSDELIEQDRKRREAT